MKLKRITALGIAAILMLQAAGCAAGKTGGKQDAAAPASTEAAAQSGADASGDTASADTKVSGAESSASAEAADAASNAESTQEASPDATSGQEAQAASPAVGDSLSRDGFTLEKVVVLSRHNIRSPLSGKGSALDTLTPHDWFEWSANPSELSVRGGILETEMGQYFRKWLEAEGLFPENYQPSENEVRFYANSKQRTIATANFFKAGLLPVADTEVEYHVDYDTMDPVFEPKLTFVSDEYCAEAEEQIRELYNEKTETLSAAYELLADVIDVEESDDFKEGKFTGFALDDLEVILEEGKEPGMSGSLKTATSVSDALVLQYYEGDEDQAAFGKELTEKQWEEIAGIKDIYQDVLFTTPLVSANVANPLLKEIGTELDTEGRKFTFLCGHDSNIGSVLAALMTEDYALPGVIEKKTPIGGKLLFTVWADSEGREYIGLDLVYQVPEQLQEMPILDLRNTPACFHLKLQGLTAAAEGLYEADQVMARIEEAVDRYDEIEDEYSLAAAA